jgi:hypothetical protein
VVLAALGIGAATVGAAQIVQRDRSVALSTSPMGVTSSVAPTDIGGAIRATLSAASVRVSGASFVAIAGAVDGGEKTLSPLRVIRVAQSGDHEEMSSPPMRPDGTVAVARLGDAPCLSFESRGSPVVTCLREGVWQELRFGPRQRLLGISPADRCWSTICVVSTTRSPGKQRTRRILRWAETGWEPVRPALPPLGQSVVMLGSSATDAADVGAPLVGMVQGPRPARRRVLTLRNGSWLDAASPHSGDFGPLVAGPLVSGRAVYMTTSDFAREPWRFGLLRWDLGGRARKVQLSRGFGNAQGEASVVAGRLWVGWSEERRRPDALRDTEYWVARLEPLTLRVLEKRRLWTGTTVLPFHVRVSDINGRPHALWVKSTWRNGRPTARVDRDLTTAAMLEPLDDR